VNPACVDLNPEAYSDDPLSRGLPLMILRHAVLDNADAIELILEDVSLSEVEDPETVSPIARMIKRTYRESIRTEEVPNPGHVPKQNSGLATTSRPSLRPRRPLFPDTCGFTILVEGRVESTTGHTKSSSTWCMFLTIHERNSN